MNASLQTLPERLQARAAASPDQLAYLHQVDGREWQPITWRELARRVDTLAGHFSDLGLQTGDRVAITLPTSPEWEYCQLAALAVGAVVVGIDAHDAPRNVRHILELTKPRLLITSTADMLRTFGELWRIPQITITCEPHPSAGHARTLGRLLETQSGPRSPASPPLPEDIATIVFTSGSTGQPKGIAYSHRQIAQACDTILERFPSLRQDSRLACWLPLSNLFQRIINFCALSCGARSYFVDKPDQIVRLLPQIQPTFFLGVPRFFEKLHAGILAELAKQPAPVRGLIHGAWTVGCRIAEARRAGRRPALVWRALHPLATPLLGRVRSVMGHELQFMVSGSAPMPRWLLERFHGLGWLVLEAYGISENVIPVAVNTPQRFRFGSVGQALPGNELRVADDHELLVRGAGVFSGYYGETADVAPLSADGFLQTGDYARIDDEGYVWLEGRKSEVFKTSTGRRIAPAPIEAALKQLDYVDHAVVVGRDRPYPVAILALDSRHPRAGEIHTAATSAAISADVAAACEGFSDYQRPGAIILSQQAFTVAGGELTANLKLRRKPIEERFRAQIEEAYDRASPRAPTTPSRPRVINAP
ncbi:AMP-dependent synthetase/ligase [Aromatoleum buckelii]|uniref:AMP-binding protein n=1 Tax=Aromatoleum buckelii TaxID=200254 RepID=A0ABX1N4F5_9RHOO|nr:AMP-binding protein [Aromatoleum buckelii]MCK0512498.1 AMP-binding protein [Aromatoleum buckelii]